MSVSVDQPPDVVDHSARILIDAPSPLCAPTSITMKPRLITGVGTPVGIGGFLAVMPGTLKLGESESCLDAALLRGLPALTASAQS